MTFVVRCLDCGHVAPYFPTSTNCPRCNSQWREAEYDYETVAPTLPLLLPGRPFDLWRYRELLPVRNSNPSLSLGEGGTPLVPAVNLGMMLGTPNLFIKDERQGPTGSFKDRQAAVTIAALKEAGITEMVAASTGNVAISYSAYAARAGVKLWAFVTSLVPAVKMREIALYGSQVVKVTGSYDQAKQVAAEFARQRNLYLDLGARTITSIEAMKTIAFEIAEQLTRFWARSGQQNGHEAVWRAPDWYVQSISGGMGPLGVYKGFRELKQMGLIDQIPSMALIQADGCAPMVQSFKEGLEQVVPVASPRTHIETLATGDPGRAYTFLRNHVLETDGTFESVTDEEAFRAMHVLAKMEGISAEPAAAVAFAGLFKLVRSGVIKARRNHRGQLHRSHDAGRRVHPRRPLDAGCRVPVEENRDAPGGPARRAQSGCLRSLPARGDHRRHRRGPATDPAHSAVAGRLHDLRGANGREGLELVRRELPDLIILDLMMPEMDGFAVLDALKADQDTAHIPVIVATAKELTPDEKDRLGTQIQALMQKGDFLNDEFLEEVKALIK